MRAAVRPGPRNLAALGVALLMMTLTARSLAQTGRSSSSSLPVAATVATGNATAGAGLYMKAGCDRCHGDEGRGTTTAPPLAKSPSQFGSFLTYVRKPAGSMPPQSIQTVSDRDLADIYAFLQSRPAALPAAGQATATAPTGRADVGKTLFAKIGCYQCHANQAQGGTAGPRIGPSPIPYARFAAYVRQPTGEMPPYTAKVLPDRDLADIYAFLQSLPQPPPVSSIPLLAP
jgi:mono/diheme cytochrome c family protein